MNRCNRLRWLVVLLGAGLAVSAGAASTMERIEAERAAAAAQANERERACQAQFSVSGCVQEARKEHRAVLSRLRQEELQYRDDQRREAAERRREDIARNVRAQQAREPADAPAGPPGRPSAPAAPAGPQPTGAGSGGVRTPPRATPDPQRGGAARREAEQRAEQAYQARLQAAQSHREQVERRNAERASQGRAAAPLPVPPPPSAPR